MPKRSKVDLKALAYESMGRYGFVPRFPAAVLSEAEGIDGAGIIKRDGSLARDLRALLWSSIDNVESLDFDQLEYCERGPDQEILVKVAIADVDSHVPKGSQTDGYAAANGSSVYTGVVIFPMLPERLSCDLTSLKPGADRLAVVIEYAVKPDGDVRHGGIYRAIVRNKAKLVYEEVGDWLEGKGAVPSAIAQTPLLQEQVRLQDEASERLRGYRMRQGTLELDTIEAKPLIRDEVVTSLIVERKNRARILIENFMVAANETMVTYLEAARLPVIQRVVRTPRDWGAIAEVAASYGWRLPPEPDSKELSKFLISQKGKDPERFPDLSLTVVKLLGAGEYMMLEPGKPPVGHFCLAIMDYTHSTAPNRRYADLLIQRLVKSVMDGKPSPYTASQLAVQSERLSLREKGAKKVERFMRKAVAAVLLSDKVGKSFDAIVTGASEKGTYVRLLDMPAEGRVIRREKGMRAGGKVRVRLISLDPYKGYIDFERA
jgi:VacB/RNase II family 3'-5' exoribonuclease